MKKAKRNEVPKDYQRNYKKEAVDFLIKFAICVGMIWLLILILLKF